jgi:hypothetical protein
MAGARESKWPMVEMAAATEMVGGGGERARGREGR